MYTKENMNRKDIANKVLGIKSAPPKTPVAPEVTIEEYIANVGDKIDTLIETIKSTREVELKGVSVVTIKGDKGDKPKLGEDYHVPKDGHTLTDEELLAIITPLIPEVADGKTPTREELLSLIHPLIPIVKDGETPTEEQLLALIKPLIPVVKDGSPDTGAEIIKKINDANGLIDQSMIKDLESTLEVLRNGLVNLGGYVATPTQFVDDETPTGAINGSNTTFVLSKTPLTGSLKVYANGQRMRVTEDYTFSGRTITFLTAPPTTSVVLVDFRY